MMARLAAVWLVSLGGVCWAQEGVQPPAPTDINITGACKADLIQHCANVPWGNGGKAKCLNKAWSKKEITDRRCKQELRAFLQKASDEGTFVKGVALSEVCKEDKQKLCASKEGSNAIFACLKAAKRKALEPDCKAKVKNLELLEAKTIELDKPFFTACADDLESFKDCSNIEKWAPSSGKKACLMRHKKQLSGTCKRALFQRLKSDMADVRLMPAVFTACQTEIKEKCSGLEFGQARVLKCLWENSGNAGFACKKEVTLATKEKESDYRLDSRIRNRCSEDIHKLCQKEQWRVDNLTISELFGDEWQDGKSGQVLQCLKANFTKIKTPECKPEIQRLVSIHAEAPQLNPVFQRTCKADIAKWCNTTKPNRLHFCLRKHMDHLSKECKAVEIVQGSVSSMDISMKPQMKRACSQAIKKFCGDVTHGDAQVIQCLQDHLEDEGIGSQCEEVVEEDLEASNHDWRLKFGVHHKCRQTVERLCSAEIPTAGGAVLSCLKTKRNGITDPGCKAEMFRFMKQGASNIKFAPTTFNACVEDVAEHCANVRPGQGRVHDCLVQHRRELSLQCATSEFEEQEIISEDARMDPKVKQVCGSSIKNLCPDTSHGDGRIWQCLSDNKDDPKMAPTCRMVVVLHITRQSYEFHLNPQLKTHCMEDASRLCPFESAMADYKEFSSEGEAITCLIKNKKEVKSKTCKGILLKKIQQRLANVDSSPDATVWCEPDIEKFCKEVPKGQGRVHACLQKHMSELTEECKQVELDDLAMQTQDARLLPYMQKKGACAAAAKRYCDDVPPGTGQKIMCMLKNKGKSDMEFQCKTELEKLLKVKSLNIRFNPMLATQCKQDLSALQQKHKQEATCQEQWNQELALQGRAINCLTEYRSEVKSFGCKMAIGAVMRLQSSDYRVKPGMKKACEIDVGTFCSDVEAGTGRVHSCLRTNVKRLSSNDCRKMVKSVWEAEKNNAILSPKIRANCKSEMDAFCPNVERGEQRLLVCLLQHQNTTGFSAACRKPLLGLGANVIVPAMMEDMRSKFLQSLERRSFWDKWGKVLLGGVAMLLVAWLVCLGFLFRFIRSKRALYGVQIDQPEEAKEPEAAP